MNFLSRKMFQSGGNVAASSFVTYNDTTKDFFTVDTFKRKLDSLPDSELFALKNLSDIGDLQLTADLQKVLNDQSEQRAVPLATTANVGMPQSFEGAISDVPRSIEASLRPVLAAFQRQIYSAEDIAASPRIQATQDYVSPIFGETFTISDVFNPDIATFQTAVASGYRNPEQVKDILGGGDFQQITSQAGQFDFRDEDIQAKVSAKDTIKNQKARNTFTNKQLLDQYSTRDQDILRTFIDPVTNKLTVDPAELGMRPEGPQRIIDIDNVPLNLAESAANLKQLSEEIDALEDRFATENIQRPEDIDVDEITNLLTQIQPPSINIEKTEADSLLETIDKFEGVAPAEELKIELDKVKLPGLTELETNQAEVAEQVKEIIKKEEELKEKEGDPDPDKAPRSPIAAKLKEPGFFGSDRFVNFVRNVGAGLVESGQMGPGLALGAAKAAEERAARDLAQDQRDAEMAKLIAIEKAKATIKAQQGPETSLKKLLRTNAQEMNADFNEIISGNNTLVTIKRVEEIVNNDDTASVAAFVSDISKRVGTFFDMNGQPSQTGLKFEDLPPRARAAVLLNNIKQANIREILGESGKTISNLDRQIIDDLVGNLKAGNNPAEILETLKLTKTRVMTNIQGAQERLLTNFNFAVQEGDYGLSLIQNNDQLINYISQLKTNPSAVPLGVDYSNKYADTTQQRRSITLAEE